MVSIINFKQYVQSKKDSNSYKLVCESLRIEWNLTIKNYKK